MQRIPCSTFTVPAELQADKPPKPRPKIPSKGSSVKGKRDSWQRKLAMGCYEAVAAIAAAIGSVGLRTCVTPRKSTFKPWLEMDWTTPAQKGMIFRSWQAEFIAAAGPEPEALTRLEWSIGHQTCLVADKAYLGCTPLSACQYLRHRSGPFLPNTLDRPKPADHKGTSHNQLDLVSRCIKTITTVRTARFNIMPFPGSDWQNIL